MRIEDLVPEEVIRLAPEELAELYLSRQQHFGLLSQELERRRASRLIHLPAALAPVADAGPHQRMIIGPELGFDIYNFHIFTSGRAAGSDRYHTHGDAVKYYVAGRGFEIIGDQRFEVKVGDWMHVPGNVWNGTENPYDEPLIFLAVQQFPGTWRQVPTPFLHQQAPHLQPPEVGDLSEAELVRLEPWPLYTLYMHHQVEFGRVQLEVQRRREQKRLYLPAEEAPLMAWGPGRHLIVAPELGFDIYTVQIFMDHLPPGARHGPWTGGDTVKYYLAGSGVEVVGNQSYEVQSGDFLHVPARTVNETRNTGPAPLRILCWQQLPGTFTQVPAPVLSDVAPGLTAEKAEGAEGKVSESPSPVSGTPAE